MSDTHWAAVELGAGLLELDRAECLDLLAAKRVGRIAYPVDKGARILPVNYIRANDCIIFRTVKDGEIFRHALDSICAFEIDDTDEFGVWSSSGACNWRLRTTSLACFTGRCLSRGPRVTDGCLSGCLARMCPGGG